MKAWPAGFTSPPAVSRRTSHAPSLIFPQRSPQSPNSPANGRRAVFGRHAREQIRARRTDGAGEGRALAGGQVQGLDPVTARPRREDQGVARLVGQITGTDLLTLGGPQPDLDDVPAVMGRRQAHRRRHQGKAMIPPVILVEPQAAHAVPARAGRQPQGEQHTR